MDEPRTLRKRNRKLLLIVLVPVALGMFGVTFAQVPLFRMFCQKIGFGLSPLANVKEGKGGREVTVLFTGVAAGALPVYFHPKASLIKAHVGERFENEYRFVNMSDDSVYFRPVHSILPEDAAKKFTMIKCFCFDDQAMAPREEKTFKVISVLSQDLNADVQQVTLHYTLFEKNRDEMEKGRTIPNVAQNIVAETKP
jgi:cytochrome c oxidase assembly protein subunit 11